jgi:hypothetical protein
MLKRHSLSEDFTEHFKENGYVILTDLFTEVELDQARSEIFSLFETRFREINEGGRAGYELLSFYYEEQKEMWRQCARRMFDLLSVYGMAAKPRVIEMLKRIGLATPMISTRPEVRTDMPKDGKYMQPWHQDWRYGQGSFNAATIWAPLHAVDVENGTIDVMPGTHLMGYLENEELPAPRRFSITDPRINTLPYFPVEMKLGEAVVFSQMLVHRSGFNQTNLPRLTVQIRYVDYSESRFVVNGLPAMTGSELLWANPPSEEDMRRMFGTRL